NTLAIADSVAGVTRALAPTLPPGVRLRLVYDQASLVRDAVKAVRDAMLVGAALAVIVLLLFLRHSRITAVSASSIPLTLVLTIAVLVSLGLACSVIPLLCERYLTVRDAEHAAPPPGTVPTALDRLGHAIDALAAWYARSLAAVLHRPQRVALVAVGLVVAGYVAYRAADTGFLPEMDEGAFVLDYWAPGGPALTETDRHLRVIDGIPPRIPEVAGTSRRTGAELGLFATLQNRGDYVVRLKPQSQRDRSIGDVIDEVRQQASAAL